VLALSWLPFAAAAHVVETDTHSLQALFAAVMFISFAHQPLTFPLVYASPWRLATHKRLFLWFPVAAVAVIGVATQVSMTLVVVVGGLWNAEHILMQRYGIVRMYGRKAGDDQGVLERWMLVVWFLIPLLWLAGTGELRHVLARISSVSVEASAAALLANMRVEALAALVLAGAVAMWLSARWLRHERHAPQQPNPGKWLYLGSTAGLFGLAMVDPIAAVVGFVGSHSVEYFVLVSRSVAAETRHAGALGNIARRRHGRLTFFAVYGLVATASFLALYRMAPATVLLLSILTIGAAHFFYDAMIWKLRKPEVATSLAVSPVTLAVAAPGPV
jgi:hypothetical protein